MGMPDVYRTLLSSDGRMRVEIFCRDDGTFGFRAFRWDVGDPEGHEGPHWCMQGGHSESVTASADEMEREVRARVTGMADALTMAKHDG